MGLFLQECYQTCHLPLLPRFRQHIKYSSVWPAAYFGCFPPLPWPCAHQTRRSTAPSHPSSPALQPATRPRRGGRGGRAAMELRGPVAKAEGALPPADRRYSELGSAARPGGPEVTRGPGWERCCSAGSPRGVPSPAGRGGWADASAAGYPSPWLGAPLAPDSAKHNHIIGS